MKSTWCEQTVTRTSAAAAVGVLLFVFALPVSGANAQESKAIRCGGFPLPYGTSIGGIASIGPGGTEKRASGVTAVAAVTTERDLHARAWVVWDERGNAWLGLTKASPADLTRLAGRTVNFDGPGMQIRFTFAAKPLPALLPEKYRLTDCPDASQ